jgi:hypothetical protein
VTEQTPRFTAEVEFPPYTHVPGQTPHPVSDTGGHQFGRVAEQLPASDFAPDRWQGCRGYLHGVDLFNHGYYWEAHEAWEAVWHATGRSGPIADLLKALIKLAAAGVKTRAASPAGRRRHCRRAAELLRRVESLSQTELLRQIGTHGDGHSGPVRLLGLSLAVLAQQAAAAESDSPYIEGEQHHPPRVFPFLILPAEVRGKDNRALPA